MNKLVVLFCSILLLCIVSCNSQIKTEEIYVKQEFAGSQEILHEYDYVLTPAELGQPKRIQELKYFVVIELDRSELIKIGKDNYNVSSYQKSDLSKNLPFLNNFINSLQIDVYLRETDKDIPELPQHNYDRFHSEESELDLSSFRLISKGSIVDDNIYISLSGMYLETRVLLDEEFDYLSQDNLELVVQLKANKEGDRRIELEESFLLMASMFKEIKKVLSPDEYYPYNNSKEEYFYPQITENRIQFLKY